MTSTEGGLSSSDVMALVLTQEVDEFVNSNSVSFIFVEHSSDSVNQLWTVANDCLHSVQIIVDSVLERSRSWLLSNTSVSHSDSLVGPIIVVIDVGIGGSTESGDSKGENIGLDFIVSWVDFSLLERVNKDWAQSSSVLCIENHLEVTSFSIIDQGVVKNFDISTWIDENIFWLDISMMIAMVFKSLDDTGETAYQIPDLSLREEFHGGIAIISIIINVLSFVELLGQVLVVIFKS